MEGNETKLAEHSEAVIRLMNMDDIEQIMEIEHECFTLPWTPGAFRNELLHNQFAHYVVVEIEGVLIGYGGMWNIMDEAHVTNVGVRRKYRGRGWGERIMRELLAAAAYIGSIKMTLEVRVSNVKAQRLYEKLGFRATGVRKRYYTDNNEDAYIMWAEVKPVSAMEKEDLK